MDDIRSENVLEKEEAPLLKINLKCSYEDYQNSRKIISQKYYDKIKFLKWYIIFFFFYFVFSVPDYIQSISNHNHLFFLLYTIIYFMSMIIIYIFICFKSHRTPILNFLYNVFVKRLSMIYKNRSIEEIKKIIIPCELIFFETYMIRKTPSLEETKKVTADKVIDLPLTSESPKFIYSKLKNIKENDNYISFRANCFIPKNQLSKNEKEQIEEILNELTQY